MERVDLRIEDILAKYDAAKKEAADGFRRLLQQRTQRALELNLRDERLLPGVELSSEARESILFAGDPIEKKKEGLDATLTYVVLRDDGRLYALEVLEQSDLADSETKKSGTLKEEIDDIDLFIEHAPRFINLLETIILRHDLYKAGFER